MVPDEAIAVAAGSGLIERARSFAGRIHWMGSKEMCARPWCRVTLARVRLRLPDRSAAPVQNRQATVTAYDPGATIGTTVTAGCL